MRDADNYTVVWNGGPLTGCEGWEQKRNPLDDFTGPNPTDLYGRYSRRQDLLAAQAKKKAKSSNWAKYNKKHRHAKHP